MKRLEIIRELEAVQHKIDYLLEELHREDIEQEDKDSITYRVGQVYSRPDGSEYLLSQVGCKMVCLMSLRGGNRWNEPISVSSSQVLTEEEFRRVCDYKDFTFVRDNRPKEL